MHPTLVVSHVQSPGFGSLGPYRVLNLGALSLNLDLRQASVTGADVCLSPAEFAILRLLAMRRNVALSKQAILAALYETGEGPDARMIDLYVQRARAKLGVFGLSGMIATVPGRGYAVLDAQGDDTEKLPQFETDSPKLLVAA